jgi:hypothetical protein
VARTNPNEDGTCLFSEKGSTQMDDDAAKTARGGADATCGGEAGYPLWDEQSCDEVAGTCAQTAAVACGDATTAGCQSDDGGGFEDACVALTGSAACLAMDADDNANTLDCAFTSTFVASRGPVWPTDTSLVAGHYYTPTAGDTFMAKVIDATALVDGKFYSITTRGTTDWTTCGAANNDISTVFEADLQIGCMGTGTATEAWSGGLELTLVLRQQPSVAVQTRAMNLHYLHDSCAQTAAVACGDATTAGCQSDGGVGFEDACAALTDSAACLAVDADDNDATLDCAWTASDQWVTQGQSTQGLDLFCGMTAAVGGTFAQCKAFDAARHESCREADDALVECKEHDLTKAVAAVDEACTSKEGAECELQKKQTCSATSAANSGTGYAADRLACRVLSSSIACKALQTDVDTDLDTKACTWNEHGKCAHLNVAGSCDYVPEITAVPGSCQRRSYRQADKPSPDTVCEYKLHGTELNADSGICGGGGTVTTAAVAGAAAYCINTFSAAADTKCTLSPDSTKCTDEQGGKCVYRAEVSSAVGACACGGGGTGKRRVALPSTLPNSRWAGYTSSRRLANARIVVVVTAQRSRRKPPARRPMRAGERGRPTHFLMTLVQPRTRWARSSRLHLLFPKSLSDRAARSCTLARTPR